MYALLGKNSLKPGKTWVFPHFLLVFVHAQNVEKYILLPTFLCKMHPKWLHTFVDKWLCSHVSSSPDVTLLGLGPTYGM